MSDKAHKIFSHCAHCDEAEFTKSEVSKDISSLLMYVRTIEISKRHIKLVSERKDYTNDKKEQIKIIDNDIKKLEELMKEVQEKYN